MPCGNSSPPRIRHPAKVVISNSRGATKSGEALAMTKDFGPIMQHGYIVEDVDKAAAEWVERVGAGPFYILDRNAMDQYYYRGVRTDVEIKLGFGYWGSVQIELIQQLNKADTLYSRAARVTAGKIN